jgi:hypothetical protein
MGEWKVQIRSVSASRPSKINKFPYRNRAALCSAGNFVSR